MIHIQEVNTIRFWQTDVRLTSPAKIHTFSSAVRNATESITIQNHSFATLQTLANFLIRFPSVSRKQQMNRLIRQIFLAFQIRIYHTADGCESLWKMNQFRSFVTVHQ